MEEQKRVKAIQFSVLWHNLVRTLARMFWVPILLAAALGFLRYRDLTRGYVPMYTCSGTYRVTAARSGSMDISTYGFYQTTNVVNSLVSSFPYVMNSDKAQSLLRDKTGSPRLPASVTCTTETTLLIFQSVAASPEDAYNALQSTVEIFPQAAAGIVQPFGLEIFEQPTLPRAAYNEPNVRSSAVKYGVLGFGIGMAVIFALAYFRKTVHNTEDLHELLSTPSLGVLPKVRFKARTKQNKKILLTNAQLEESYVEAMRGVCFQLRKELETQPAKVIMVTSTSPSEGKSTVSANLALMLSSEGARVVLVDCDLRKQTLKDLFGVTEPSVGLVDLIKNGGSVDKALLSVEGSRLKLLSGDRIADHPQNFLSAPELHTIMSELRRSYDYVIVDTPPSGLLSDAATLSEWSDGAIYVVRQDFLNDASILDSVQRLSESDVRFIGSVINLADRSTSHSGYGYGGYGGYGYAYYGYGSKKYYTKGASGDEDEIPMIDLKLDADD